MLARVGKPPPRETRAVEGSASARKAFGRAAASASALGSGRSKASAEGGIRSALRAPACLRRVSSARKATNRAEFQSTTKEPSTVPLGTLRMVRVCSLAIGSFRRGRSDSGPWAMT